MSSIREIRLTRGQSSPVDESDFERFGHLNWCVNSKGYALRKRTASDGPGPRSILLHREVIGAAQGEIVDHINRNRLDNRRTNLRICTCAGNMQNSARKQASASGYRGVIIIEAIRKKRGLTKYYMARIRANGNIHYIGCFKSAEEAARAYDKAAIKLHGEFASLNFPQ